VLHLLLRYYYLRKNLEITKLSLVLLLLSPAALVEEERNVKPYFRT
jgi:hypothetical protein